MIKLGIYGCSGRMGQEIVKVALTQNSIFSVEAVFEHSSHPGIGKKYLNTDLIVRSAASLSDDEAIDLLIDFSTKNGTATLTKKLQCPTFSLLIGSTALSSSILKKLKDLSKKTAVFVSSNTSIGMHILNQVTENITKKIGARSGISIHEIHHDKKVDAPSGSALTLLSTVKQSLPEKGKRKKIGVSSERVGAVPGIHQVSYYYGDEKITISHEAISRRIFADGALTVGSWLVKQNKNFYSMSDFLP